MMKERTCAARVTEAGVCEQGGRAVKLGGVDRHELLYSGHLSSGGEWGKADLLKALSEFLELLIITVKT